MSKRLHVNINDETAAALKSISEADEVSVTELIRRSVSVYKFLHDALYDQSKTLNIVDTEGQTTRVVLV